jgi:methionine sulfoxide reductase heme-binding subunit
VSSLVAASSPTTLWYLTRATGVVALLLLTGAVVLGVLSSIRWRSERLPRFLVGGLHRNVTLLAVAFVVVHVVTTVADGYAPVGLKDALIPFVSPYRPVWLGLGAVAFDLLLALVVTSFLRARLGYRLWRAVHWLAYASWPVALLHSFGTGSDVRLGWMAWVGFGCFALVAASVLVRVARSTAASGPRVVAAAVTLLVPLLIVVWYRGGPQRKGWAAHAGTPVALLRRAAAGSNRASLASETSLPSGSFDASLAGHVTNSAPSSDGLVTVNIQARVRGRVHGRLRLTLWGQPTQDGGVAMTASDVAFAGAGTSSAYTGRVVSLDGNRVEAQLRNASGARADLTFDLQLDRSSDAVSGSLHGTSTP